MSLLGRRGIISSGVLGAGGSPFAANTSLMSGTTEYFSVADTAALSSSNVSWSVFAYRTSGITKTTARIFNKWGASAGTWSYFSYWDNNTNTIIAGVSTDGSSVSASVTSATLSRNTWYHVGFSYDGSTLKLYIDAGTPVTTSHSGTIFDGGAATALGHRDGSTTQDFPGRLFMADVYDDTLTAGEFTLLCNSGTPECYADRDSSLTDSNNVGSWEVGNWSGHTGSELVDQSGNSHTLTNTGSVPYTGDGINVACT